MNNKEHHISVMVDLTKAFDTVQHGVLLGKMRKYGIRGIALKFFENYLHNRKSFVKIGSKLSSLKTINIGIPQGSILGPIFFLIYINDLPNILKSTQPLMFADDTTISSSHSSCDVMLGGLNADLGRVVSWCVSNRLTINTQKTEALLFSNRLHDVSDQRVVLGGDMVALSSSCRFLGVHLDSNISFTSHIDHIISKISKNNGILYRIRGSTA